MYKYVASCVQIISTRIKNPYKVIAYFIKTLVKHNYSILVLSRQIQTKCASAHEFGFNAKKNKIWWVWLELNQRPHPYQGCALTNWATDPFVASISTITSLHLALIQSRTYVRSFTRFGVRLVFDEIYLQIMLFLNGSTSLRSFLTSYSQ